MKKNNEMQCAWIRWQNFKKMLPSLIFLCGLCGDFVSFLNAQEDIPQPTYANVAYGPDERNVMDVWIPQGMDDKAPFPCVLYIHGGSWINGDKSEPFKKFKYIQTFLPEGIAVASINYRLMGKHPFPAPLNDAARAMQFLKYKSQEWKINKNKIAVGGQSAGGCSSLWLAFVDDLADAKSDDPVAHESTRPVCVFVTQAQSTLDPKQMVEWTGNDVVYKHAMIKTVFGYPDTAKDPDGSLVKKYSPAAQFGAGDPPILFGSSGKETPPAEGDTNHAIHHPGFSTGLQALAEKAGVPFTKISKPKDTIGFLKKHLLENP